MVQCKWDKKEVVIAEPWGSAAKALECGQPIMEEAQALASFLPTHLGRPSKPLCMLVAFPVILRMIANAFRIGLMMTQGRAQFIDKMLVGKRCGCSYTMDATNVLQYEPLSLEEPSSQYCLRQ